MPETVFEKSVLIDSPVEDVFAFCNSRVGFERHFPHKVDWLSGPETWRKGTELFFKFNFLGLWLDFRTKITRWEENRVFKDEMVVGPYRRFAHTHLFKEAGGSTLYTDRVEFSTGFGRFVDQTIGMWLVRSTFVKRHARMKELLESGRRAARAEGKD